LRVYEVAYDGGRIKEMKNDAVRNGDRLEYSYDDAGRVSTVGYVDSNGVVFTRLFYSYDVRQLTGIERQRRVTSGFITDKLTALSYFPDCNLLEPGNTTSRIDGQQETTTVDRFELHDDMINVDGFGLIHDEPPTIGPVAGVQPRRAIRRERSVPGRHQRRRPLQF
jgi:hypothetical protein